MNSLLIHYSLCTYLNIIEHNRSEDPKLRNILDECQTILINVQDGLMKDHIHQYSLEDIFLRY